MSEAGKVAEGRRELGAPLGQRLAHTASLCRSRSLGDLLRAQIGYAELVPVSVVMGPTRRRRSCERITEALVRWAQRGVGIGGRQAGPT